MLTGTGHKRGPGDAIFPEGSALSRLVPRAHGWVVFITRYKEPPKEGPVPGAAGDKLLGTEPRVS